MLTYYCEIANNHRITREILSIKKREYIVEFKQMIEKATDDGLTKGDINEILKIVLGEKDYENQSK